MRSTTRALAVLAAAALLLAPAAGSAHEHGFGDASPVPLLLIDHGVPDTNKTFANGWSADEVLSFKLPDKTGSFKLHASYVATNAPAPYLYGFHERGRIAEAEGRFAGARGHLTITGAFTLGPAETFIDPAHDPFLWIAQVEGRYCGPR